MSWKMLKSQVLYMLRSNRQIICKIKKFKKERWGWGYLKKSYPNTIFTWSKIYLDRNLDDINLYRDQEDASI